MNPESPEQKIDQEKYNDIANRLEELQAKENDGRGIGCVQTVVGCLRRGDVSSAKVAARTDGDKIISYPEVYDFIKKELFEGEDY
jgi:hypothetical protein